MITANTPPAGMVSDHSDGSMPVNRRWRYDADLCEIRVDEHAV